MLATAAWAPPAILFTWNALDAKSPGSFLADNWDVVPRFLAAGAIVALTLTTLSLFAASFATRRAYASVAILAGLFVGSAIGGIAEDSFTGPLADALSLASIPAALLGSVHWIFGDPIDAAAARLGEHALAPRPDGRARARAAAPDRAAGAGMSGVGSTEPPGSGGTGSAEAGAGLSAAAPTIVVESLSKWFEGVVAVSDVSLVVEPGVTALLGPNGAGKTTLLRAIAGLTAPVAGPRHRLRRASARQPTALPPDRLHARARVVYDMLTGRQFVELNARLQGVDDVDARRRARGRDGRPRRRAGPRAGRVLARHAPADAPRRDPRARPAAADARRAALGHRPGASACT